MNKPDLPHGLDILCYDVEIVNLPGKHPGVNWSTHEKMRNRVAVTYSFLTGDYQVYLEDQTAELCKALNSAKLVTGFNICGFDHKVIRPYAPLDCKSYDAYFASRAAVGSRGGRPGGLKLNDHLEAMFNMKKTDDGALVDQMSDSRVITYCLGDVRREAMLFTHMWVHGWVETPRHGRREIQDPWEYFNGDESHEG